MAIIEDNWNYRIDINKSSDGVMRDFEPYLCSLQEDVLNKTCFKIQLNNSNYVVNSHVEQVKKLTEENKQLRLQIDAKVNEVAKQKSLYDSFKQGENSSYEDELFICSFLC